MRIRGYDDGQLAEVRYIDVVRSEIASPDRQQFIKLVQQAQLTDEDLSDCRIGYVDANGVGDYASWQKFLDMKTATG